MITLEILKKLAHSFPEVSEEPHFEKISFRVNKKIFLTYDDNFKKATVKLSEINQDVFSKAPGQMIYPVENKWGKQGWTIIDLQLINENLFKDALTMAYCEVAPRQLAAMVRPRDAD